MSPKNLLIIGHTWPNPNATAAGSRMLQLIRFFLEQSYKITFTCASKELEIGVDLATLDIEKANLPMNDDSFDSFIKLLDPKIVIFDRFFTEEQFGWRVAQFAPKALRILDTEDLHSLRFSREASIKKGVPFSSEIWLRESITKREVASIYRSDLSLIISTFEMQLLKNVIKMEDAILCHLPFMLPAISKETSNSWLPYDQRKDFMFIGNGKHAPNVDAIKWLKNQIWPLIHSALPEAKLHIYGHYLPKQILSMHKPKEGFYINGPLPNVAEAMGTARINLAPLRFGAGLKGKLIDAMTHGLPSITTSIGVEGIHQNLPWSGRIADSAETLAHAAISLYNSRAEWKMAQENGIDIINNLYGSQPIKLRLAQKIDALQNNLDQHRTENFIGAMLQHHSAASTKYLSKWIEAKNRAESHQKN